MLKLPVSIDGNELLINASNLLKEKKVDSLVVTDKCKAIGMLDVQDLMNLS